VVLPVLQRHADEDALVGDLPGPGEIGMFTSTQLDHRAVTMKMMSSTSITSRAGRTLIFAREACEGGRGGPSKSPGDWAAHD